jgi:Carboxypeptidase regulatory-like domain
MSVIVRSPFSLATECLIARWPYQLWPQSIIIFCPVERIKSLVVYSPTTIAGLPHLWFAAYFSGEPIMKIRSKSSIKSSFVLLSLVMTAHSQDRSAITGQVASEDGARMAYIAVYLTEVGVRAGSQMAVIRRKVVTDGEGNFIFRNLQPRRYSIDVMQRKGYALSRASGETGNIVSAITCF